jgi:beta-lactamase superfamily II metal-dependent hydrolase
LGDNSTKSLKYLKENITPPITVLKIGHHGGKNSVNDEMLNFLKPGVIIITTGRNNYFHPNKKTVQTIEKHKIPMYRTDFDNAVKISSDGEKQKFTHMTVIKKAG